MSSTPSNRTRAARQSSPHRNHDVYVRRVHNLVLQLNGDRDWSAGPASNPRNALSKIRALLTDKVDPVFSSLSDDLPDSGYLLEDDELVGVVLEDLDCFSMTCEAVGRTASNLGLYSDLDDRLYAMWPHALKWLAFFHPGNGRIRCPTAASHRHFVLGSLALIYLLIFQTNRGHVKRLLVERPDMLHPIFDLWLKFPQYVPPVAGQSKFDPIDTIHNILKAVACIYNLVAGWDNSHNQRGARSITINGDDARDIFIRELRRHVRGKGGLHVHFAKRNQYLLELPMPPHLAEGTWHTHLEQQIHILNLPAFQLDVAPRSFLRSVVSSGNHCIQRGWHECALRAVAVVIVVCEASSSNRTLRRCIEAGAYDLLLAAAKISEGDRAVQSLSYKLSIGLAQQSLLRAFHRMHGDRFVYPEKLSRDPKQASY
ncbi:hypothetical protein BD626DRAFT_587310 [Schizophyllum amplum]|uniref:Uncharacterized protein n=1 Tax=Schizophyllum amplum TaxID=97359 RepID=A0A550BVD6_9AGAR|nr:hypothetical protein BD626DRAFT_587310 [Auriculariopsis ampla]